MIMPSLSPNLAQSYNDLKKLSKNPGEYWPFGLTEFRGSKCEEDIASMYLFDVASLCAFGMAGQCRPLHFRYLALNKKLTEEEISSRLFADLGKPAIKREKKRCRIAQQRDLEIPQSYYFSFSVRLALGSHYSGRWGYFALFPMQNSKTATLKQQSRIEDKTLVQIETQTHSKKQTIADLKMTCMINIGAPTHFLSYPAIENLEVLWFQSRKANWRTALFYDTIANFTKNRHHMSLRITIWAMIAGQVKGWEAIVLEGFSDYLAAGTAGWFKKKIKVLEFLGGEKSAGLVPFAWLVVEWDPTLPGSLQEPFKNAIQNMRRG